jgi:hypothetical protein
MLIIYRTNPGFKGDIVSLDYKSLKAEAAARLAQMDSNDLGCLEIDQATIDDADLADLVLHCTDPARWYVAIVNGEISLVTGTGRLIAIARPRFNRRQLIDDVLAATTVPQIRTVLAKIVRIIGAQ